MVKIKQLLKRMFFLPPLPTFLAALFGFGFVIFVAVFKISIPAVQYASYICSAYALVISVTGFPHLLSFVKALKLRVNDHPLMRKIRCTAIGERFFTDIRFRSDISLYKGFFINLLYIAMKMVSGIYYQSVWFIALAIYYVLLAVTRFVLLRKEKKLKGKTQMQIEIVRYRQCGVMLLIMNQALACIVVFMVYQNRGFNYPGLLIYGMALYAFYAVITAVVNLIKFRKHGSPVMSAAKAVSFVSALVSMLSLTTAMLAQFGGNDTSNFRQIMTASVGGVVCTIVIGMAIFMICKSSIQLKKLNIASSQE